MDFFEAKAESKIECQKQIDELRKKREVVSSKLDEINKSSGEAWKHLKAGLEKATDDLKGALEKAMDKFK